MLKKRWDLQSSWFFFCSAQDQDPNFSSLEQEAWTICRIFKRQVSCKRYSPPQRWESPAPSTYSSSKASSEESGGFSEAFLVQNFVEENDWNKLRSPAHGPPLIIEEDPSYGSNDLFFEDSWDEIQKIMGLEADPQSFLNDSIYWSAFIVEGLICCHTFQFLMLYFLSCWWSACS